MVTSATQDLVVSVESEKVPTVEVDGFGMSTVWTEFMGLDCTVRQVIRAAEALKLG